MQEIFAWIMLNRLLTVLIAVCTTIVIAIIMYIFNSTFRKSVNFWWLNVKTTMPIFGTIARLNDNDIKADSGWYGCELKLCKEYRKFDNQKADGEIYKKCKSYLSSMAEQGRSPTPFLIWVYCFFSDS